MVHTRFFSDEHAAKAEYADMQDTLTSILNVVPEASEAEDMEKMRRLFEAVASAKFPEALIIPQWLLSSGQRATMAGDATWPDNYGV